LKSGYCKGVDVTIQIPDRRALEALAAEEYRLGRLNKPDLRRLLAFETSHEIEEFLSAHQIFDDYTSEDLEREREGLQRLGF